MESQNRGWSHAEVVALYERLAAKEREYELRLQQSRQRLVEHLRQDAGTAAGKLNAEQPAGHRTVGSPNDCDAVLTVDHELVLKTLARTPHRCVQIADLAAIGPIRNRETVGSLLKDMASFGLVHRPYGRRKGYALTKAGLDRVRLLAA